MSRKPSVDDVIAPIEESAGRDRARAVGSGARAASGSSVSAPSPVTTWIGAAVVAIAVALAYSQSFSGPFVFDDPDAILDNPTIRHLSDLGRVLAPPQGMTVSGRPVLNLSLAANYAISGPQVWSYHAFNVVIHALAGLVLFGLVRRTLQLGRLRARFEKSGDWVALAAALVWALHPLQTEAVTYVVQRAESLMALFYLLTLYCFVRGATAQANAQQVSSIRWFAASGVACLLGMGTKEVMVSAPLIVLLYDRTFVAGTFRGAMRQHGRAHLALGCCYVALAYFVLSTGGNRGGSAGFDVGVSPLAYWLTQFEAIVHYLRLAIWPTPLIFEYGVVSAGPLLHVRPFAVLILALGAATLVALWRQPIVGFVGAWFWCILAPTSIVPGTTQMIVEHRMYLALAPLVAAAVALTFWAVRIRALAACGVAALALGLITLHRNADYATDLGLWRDTVVKRPGNPLAHYALGNALLAHDRAAEALPELEEALRLKPDDADAEYNYGNALLRLDRLQEAAERYRAAIRRQPKLAAAHANLGGVLVRLGRVAEGVAELRRALAIDASLAETHYALGNALKTANDEPAAIAEYEATVRLAPDHFRARNNLGNLLVHLGRFDEAIRHFEAAVASAPSNALLRVNYGNALAAAGRIDAARTQYELALRLDPENAAARQAVGLLSSRGQAKSAPARE